MTKQSRTSCGEPNVQNIPIRTEIGKSVREAFQPKPGTMLIQQDFSELEVRIAAQIDLGFFKR